MLHDLRIEHAGRVAQIDHLLIDRFLTIYVLESKNYSNGMRITEQGEFQIFYAGKSRAVESPIEQNERHIYLLKMLFKDKPELLPKRLGFTLKPSFKSYIMVSPTSKVIRPKKNQFDTSAVIKSDEIMALIQKDTDAASITEVMTIGKLIGQDTLQHLGLVVSQLHVPSRLTDYRKKFGIEQCLVQPETDVELSQQVTSICPRCGSELVERVAKKGANAGNKFLGCSTFPKCRYIGVSA